MPQQSQLQIAHGNFDDDEAGGLTESDSVVNEVPRDEGSTDQDVACEWVDGLISEPFRYSRRC